VRIHRQEARRDLDPGVFRALPSAEVERMPLLVGPGKGRLLRRGWAALAALLAVSWASVSAATPPVVRPLDSEIARLQASAGQNRLDRRGLAFVRHESGSLRVDETKSFEIELRRGDRLLAVGVCDEG
jgi:hypothetical protein